jgi:hypothetical protein
MPNYSQDSAPNQHVAGKTFSTHLQSHCLHPPIVEKGPAVLPAELMRRGSDTLILILIPKRVRMVLGSGCLHLSEGGKH